MANTLTETVAAEVRAELARQSISRTEAAQRLGMSRTALWSKLRGDYPFKLAELQEVAEMLGVSVTRFLPADVEAAS